MRAPLPAACLLSTLLAAALPGCGPSVSITEEEARGVLEPALQAATPAGRTGLLLKGKNVWLQAPVFDKSCLEQKDLAFNDDPGSRPAGQGGVARISPTYLNQRFLTASTPTGYCLVLGEGLQAEIKEATFDWGTQDRWRFQVAYTMQSPTPWFECLDEKVRTREIVVRQGDGEGAAPVIEGTVALAEGDCPHPMPLGEDRTARAAPSGKPKGAPSRADVEAAVQRFDEALWAGDFLAVRDAMVCYNLFEDDKVGSCSVGELVALGPVPRGEPRMQDGTPWLEYLQDDWRSFGRVVPDGKDRTLVHVMVEHKRTKAPRSFSLQWDGGEWKVVGIVARQAESITAARIINDLHDRKKRDIFGRRLAGERIDEQGNPLDPVEEEEEAPPPAE